MAYVETEADIDKQEQDTKRIEEALALAMLILFARVETQFVTQYLQDETVTDVSNFEDELKGQLRQSYAAVNAVIGGQIMRYLLLNRNDPLSQAVAREADKNGATFEQQVNTINLATQVAVNNLFTERANFAAPKIVDTTNRQLQLYVGNILEATGGSAPRQVVSTLAATQFRDLAPWRADYIAGQEVATISSGITQTETEALAEELVETQVKFYKEWITRGDDKVRPHHVAADGQIREYGEPFVVMGQELMYPRDASLGATASNTARCRCASIRNLDV